MSEHIRISRKQGEDWELWSVDLRGTPAHLATFPNNPLSRLLLVQATKAAMKAKMVEDLEVYAEATDIDKLEKIDPELFDWFFDIIIPEE